MKATCQVSRAGWGGVVWGRGAHSAGALGTRQRHSLGLPPARRRCVPFPLHPPPCGTQAPKERSRGGKGAAERGGTHLLNRRRLGAPVCIQRHRTGAAPVGQQPHHRVELQGGVGGEGEVGRRVGESSRPTQRLQIAAGR